MATLQQGILGGFSGKVGPVVGSSWKGKAVIRAKALSIHNPNTEEQQKVRAHFALLAQFVSRSSGFINVGFKTQAQGMTECNAALAANYDNGITGTFPNYALNYSALQVSKGSLDLPYSPSASLDNSNLTIGWTDNSDLCNGSPEDKLMLLVYNSSKEQVVYNTSAAMRNETTYVFNCPSTWNGDDIEVYIAFRSAKDDTTSKSAYMGHFSL